MSGQKRRKPLIIKDLNQNADINIQVSFFEKGKLVERLGRKITRPKPQLRHGGEITKRGKVMKTYPNPQTPIITKMIERIFAILAGCLFSILGYNLYSKGISTGESTFKWGRFILEGQGPGILFMFTGAIIIVIAIKTQIKVTQKVLKEEGKNKERMSSWIQYLHKPNKKIERNTSSYVDKYISPFPPQKKD